MEGPDVQIPIVSRAVRVA